MWLVESFYCRFTTEPVSKSTLKIRQHVAKLMLRLDGCIVWNAHNTVLGEEALLIYIVPVCYVKQVGMERPSNIIISLRRKKFNYYEYSTNY